jgi:hypothetical protein
MVEESKRDAKPEGSGKKPNEGGKDKPVDKLGAEAANPAEQKPGDAGGAAPKPGQPAGAKEPEKRTGASVPPSGAGAKPGPSTPPPGGGAKPGEAKRPPAAPPKKAQKSGCLSSVFWLLAVLVVIVVVGYFTWPQWSHYAAPYLAAEDSRVTELETRVEEIERKLSAPRPEIKAIESLQADRQKINERLSSAHNEVESLQKAIASLTKMAELVKGADTVDADKIVTALTLKIDGVQQELTRSVEQAAQNTAEIEKRINELETKAQAADDGTSGAAAAALAVGQLAQALNGSGPFSAELNAVKAFAKDDAEMAAAIAALEPRAAGGVPTVAELRSRFPAVADAVSRADNTVKGDGWVESAVNRLSSLVSVRKTGEAAIAGGGTDAALAGAEGALAAGDLAAAVQALETLEPPAAEAAAGWLGDAHARMTAERLLATLQARAISLLAARG